MNWEDFQLFLTVARERSFPGAARSLGVSYSTLARRVALFEKRLGAKLFIRQHGELSLTVEGKAVMSAAGRISATAAALERELKGISKKPEGNVCVTLTQSVLCGLILPHLREFRLRHPQIRLEFDTSREFRDILKGEADIAIRLTDNHEYEVPDSLLGLRLPSIHVHAYAPRKLAARINGGEAEDGIGVIKWDKRINFGKMAAHFNLQDWPVVAAIDDTRAQLEAVKNGIGVAIVPCYLADVEPAVARIRAGIAPMAALDAWAVAHPDMRDVEKIRAVMKFASGCFARHERLITGKAGRSIHD